MKFVFYTSLKPAAKKAINKGNGDHGNFRVDGDYIALLENGRPLEFVKVIRDNGEVIRGIQAE